ncbi:hypothetical protein AVEN_124067-1 [Araneus ventricosus]|uniref:C2H2-type domain-containing protein n=1 Tax=Araneus ventricosus TaxID=182803 RepID=A0A4Y2SRI0_ARAVE|nr:hypothetical protein AVEN_124067-1 [Araneus ventricosus]
MNLSRAVGYIIRNEQRRTERSQETVQESTVRQSIRNEADNRRRPKRVCIRNDVEEHNCGTMSEQCGFCGAVYWKEEKNTAHKYTHGFRAPGKSGKVMNLDNGLILS